MTVTGNVAMMIEDFTGTEKRIEMSRDIASKGLAIQAHAGNYSHDMTFENAYTNGLAVFLIGA